MKKLSLTSFLFLMSFFIIGQNSPFSTQPNSTKQRNPDTFSLPFFEDWSSGSLETNNWTTECENWVINDLEGNEEPSVEFTGEPTFQKDYLCSLISNTFNCKSLAVGKIILDFDIELDTRNATGEEKIVVEIFDETNWNTIAEFVNNTDFDWVQNSIDISRYALGHSFQIRFKAVGENSHDILYWFIDNISFYRLCETPNNLQANVIWSPATDSGISVAEVSWIPPESVLINESAILHWDDGVNNNSIGLAGGGNFSVAAKWDSLHLVEYFDDTIQSIRFMLNDTGFNKIIVKVWIGTDGENLIYQDTVDNPLIGDWNEQILDSVILIDPGTIYWVGYTIDEQPAITFPASYDNGPAIPGYGDLIYIESSGWAGISEFGIDHNFNIQMKLTNSDASVRNCFGFTVLKKIIGEDPEYVTDSVLPFIKKKDSYVYYDADINYYATVICYKVATVWLYEGDTCISDFAKTVSQDDDYACILTSNIESINANNQLTIYPNPASHTLNISSRDRQAIEEVCLYNLTGQIVFRGEAQNNILDISGLPAGMYVIEAVLGSERIRRKLIIR